MHIIFEFSSPKAFQQFFRKCHSPYVFLGINFSCVYFEGVIQLFSDTLTMLYPAVTFSVILHLIVVIDSSHFGVLCRGCSVFLLLWLITCIGIDDLFLKPFWYCFPHNHLQGVVLNLIVWWLDYLFPPLMVPTAGLAKDCRVGLR